MTKIINIVLFIFCAKAIVAQPILYSDSLHKGLNFNLYTLSNVSNATLSPSGANVTWDLSSSTTSPNGSAGFLDMASTGYATLYPTANFAVKFNKGVNTNYSLFHLTQSILEEVANNVGSSNPIEFSDPRTALVFPFTFTLNNSDTYQKKGQATKTISNAYDAYGILKAGNGTFSNTVRILTTDNGNISATWWNTLPLMPIFQADGSGYTLWMVSNTATGLQVDFKSNKVFDLYPNPATNELVIINKENIIKIDIINSDGQLQFSGTQSVINIARLAPGIYFIKAYTTNSVTTERFTKQ